MCWWHGRRSVEHKGKGRKEIVNPLSRKPGAGYWHEDDRTEPGFRHRCVTQAAELGWTLEDIKFIDRDWQIADRQRRWKDFMGVGKNLFRLVLTVAAMKYPDVNVMDQKSRDQPTCLDKKKFVPLVLEMFDRHLHWHPAKDLSPDQRDAKVVVDVFAKWREQIIEITELCKSHHEPYMWEYLMMEWYSPARWALWARAISPVLPIVNSNAPVESHWSSIKRYLFRGNRPSLPLAAASLIESFLPELADRIECYRSGVIKPHCYRRFREEWRKAARQNTADDKNIYDDLCWELSEVFTRNKNVYHTSLSHWYCGCPAFVGNAYHVCKHLVRICGPVPPSYGSVHRQRASPILWIRGVHGIEDLQNSTIYKHKETSRTLAYGNLLRQRDETDTEMQRQVRERAVGAVVERQFETENTGLNYDEDEDGVWAADWIDDEMLLPTDEEEYLERFVQSQEGRAKKTEMPVVMEKLEFIIKEFQRAQLLDDDDEELLEMPAVSLDFTSRWLLYAMRRMEVGRRELEGMD
jgi:hypothetical protein